MIENNLLECEYCGRDDGTHECECGWKLTTKQCKEQYGICKDCGRSLK
jgi:hypothetical protein